MDITLEKYIEGEKKREQRKRVKGIKRNGQPLAAIVRFKSVFVSVLHTRTL